MKYTEKSDLLLLHGALGCMDQFNLLKEQLKDSFTVHTLNFSGHGGREMPANGFNLDIFEMDVLNYMESNSIHSVSVFGYSMGGYVALSLAAKYPEKINAVLTLATKLDWNPESALRESAMLDPDRMLQKVPEFAEQLRLRHHPVDWRFVLRNTYGLMIGLGDTPLGPEQFRAIQCPVRLSVGDRDKMVSLDETRSVFKLLTRGSLAVWPDTPHPFELVNLNRLVFELNDFFMQKNQP